MKESLRVIWGALPGGCSPHFSSVQFISVAQSCLTLCYLMDCSMPGFPVHHQLLELLKLMSMSHWCHSTISSSVVPFSSCLQFFPVSWSFPMSQFFALGSPSIGVSASASVFPMNIQDWFPLGLTGWIFLQSKGLSRVFSNTTVQKHQFFSAQLFYRPTLTSSFCPQWNLTSNSHVVHLFSWHFKYRKKWTITGRNWSRFLW